MLYMCSKCGLCPCREPFCETITCNLPLFLSTKQDAWNGILFWKVSYTLSLEVLVSVQFSHWPILEDSISNCVTLVQGTDVAQIHPGETQWVQFALHSHGKPIYFQQICQIAKKEGTSVTYRSFSHQHWRWKQHSALHRDRSALEFDQMVELLQQQIINSLQYISNI